MSILEIPTTVTQYLPLTIKPRSLDFANNPHGGRIEEATRVRGSPGLVAQHVAIVLRVYEISVRVTFDAYRLHCFVCANGYPDCGVNPFAALAHQFPITSTPCTSVATC